MEVQNLCMRGLLMTRAAVLQGFGSQDALASAQTAWELQHQQMVL